VGRLITVDEIPRYAGGELVLDSLGIGHPGFRMRVFRYAPSNIHVPATEDFLVVVYRKGAAIMNRRVTGAWKHEHVGHGISTLLTRSAASYWRWDTALEVGHFYISPAFISNIASEMFDREIADISFHDLVGAKSAELSWINQQLAAEISAAAPGGRLYFDALAVQACVHLLRHYATVKFKPPRPQGHFGRAEARRLEDYIEHNIARNITLDELAALCQCSLVQFARKFRVHYQMRPHAFMQQRKVEHACQLLRKGRLALKEIALDSGFSDQSHLNRVFRQHLGCTPGQFREARATTPSASCPPLQSSMRRE